MFAKFKLQKFQLPPPSLSTTRLGGFDLQFQIQLRYQTRRILDDERLR